MKPSEVMSDKEIALTGAAFALALERRPFAERLVAHGLLSDIEIYIFYHAVFAGQVETFRQLLDKIYGVVEEDKNDIQS